MRTASATRSVTESKKAPLTDAVPAALATGPSKRSCMPVTMRKMMARWRWPVATRTAVAAAETRPVAVSTSAVMPWRWSVSPTGPVVRSTALSPTAVEHEAPRGARARGGARPCLQKFTIRPPKPGGSPVRGVGAVPGPRGSGPLVTPGRFPLRTGPRRCRTDPSGAGRRAASPAESALRDAACAREVMVPVSEGGSARPDLSFSVRHEYDAALAARHPAPPPPRHPAAPPGRRPGPGADRGGPA